MARASLVIRKYLSGTVAALHLAICCIIIELIRENLFLYYSKSSYWGTELSILRLLAVLGLRDVVPHLTIAITAKTLAVSAKNYVDFLVWEGEIGTRRMRSTILILGSVGTRIMERGVPGTVWGYKNIL